MRLHKSSPYAVKIYWLHNFEKGSRLGIMIITSRVGSKQNDLGQFITI